MTIAGPIYGYNLLLGWGSYFGEYVQTYEQTTNIMKPQTVGALKLRLACTTQGNFINLALSLAKD